MTDQIPEDVKASSLFVRGLGICGAWAMEVQS